jgi:hypothetical protein
MKVICIRFLRADSTVLMVMAPGCSCGCFRGMISAREKAWKMCPYLDIVFLFLQAEERDVR